MRAHAPRTIIRGGVVSVRTEIDGADGEPRPALETTVSATHVDLLDTTAGPGVAALVALAVAAGEDLVIEGPVAAPIAASALEMGELLARWWERPSPRITIEDQHPARSAAHAPGVGLFFSRGADSWSTLLDLVAEGGPGGLTHLVAVRHGTAADRAVEDEIIARHRRVAAERGLELVEITTTARENMDPLRPWIDTYGPVLVSAGRVLGGGIGRLVLSSAHPASISTRSGSDPALVAALDVDGARVTLGNPERDRIGRLAHLLTDPQARAELQVCWEGGTAGNCGRCRKCQLTMAGLVVAGDPDPTAGFGHHLDATLVPAFEVGPSIADLVRPLVAGLPPEHEELRRAWADTMARGAGESPRERWGDDSPPGLSGPGVPARVADALRATTGQPDGPAPAPLGWRPGSVPLRPRFADHDRIRAAAARAAERPRPWAVVEHHIRDGRRDGAQADLALRLGRIHGPGAVYLPGILWAHEAPPALDPDAVATLLRTARVRAWWREEGDLDPLRVVEAIEQGCAPLQFMPDGSAHALRDELTATLRACVVAESELTALDLAPAAVARRLEPVVEHLLAGSAERDLLAGAHGA